MLWFIGIVTGLAGGFWFLRRRHDKRRHSDLICPARYRSAAQKYRDYAEAKLKMKWGKDWQWRINAQRGEPLGAGWYGRRMAIEGLGEVEVGAYSVIHTPVRIVQTILLTDPKGFERPQEFLHEAARAVLGSNGIAARETQDHLMKLAEVF